MSRRFAVAGLMAVAMAVTGMAAQAQKRVAPTAAATTNTNRQTGKPMVLNGIRETRLSNGLTVLTKEVHAAPVVYFSVYYKVGSVNEEVGETGMSHLMEHMMFKGTRTRPPGAISAALQDAGANFNASTSFDRTEYHETLGSDRLEMAMQLESDRMVNSLYDEKEHQKEMTVVRSEYEGGENNPGTVLTKAVRLAAYSIHPYRWLPIGFRADIENFTRNEMYAYYKNYYAPNNAVVVIVGDFDTTSTLAMARRYFGAIPAHPVVEHFITPEPAQEGERRTIVRRAGTTPQMQIAYHIPAFGNQDRYALDVLEGVLSGGRTARFFPDLIQTGLAAGADAFDFSLRYPDLFTLSAVAQPGHTNEELEKALLAEVDRVQKEPISGEELTRALRQAEAGYILGRDSVSEQGSELGGNAMRGDWRYGETYLQNLRKVTAADVQRVAQRYLVANNRTVGYFEPLPLTGGATPRAGSGSRTGPPPAPHFRPEGWTGDRVYLAQGPSVQRMRTMQVWHPARKPRVSRSVGRSGSTGMTPAQVRGIQTAMRRYNAQQASYNAQQARYYRAFQQAAQRANRAKGRTAPAVRKSVSPSRRPPGARPRSRIPQPMKIVLDNGMTVVVLENHANPSVAISGAVLSAGGMYDPEDKPGLAAFTASQLSRGAEGRSLMDLARSLEDVGASLGISGDTEYVSFSGRAVARDLGTLLGVLSDELRHPSFPAQELERARRQTLAGIEQARQNTSALASIAISQALFPPGHPYYSHSLDEQAAALRAFTREDLVNFHKSHYGPEQTLLMVVGDVNTAAVVANIRKLFDDWQRNGALPSKTIPNVTPTTGSAKPTVVQVPDKAQVDVRYGYPGQLKRDDPDFYPVAVLDTVLGGGGGLSSRLAVSVRDKLGLVYFIGAFHQATLGAGPFEVQFGSNPANVDRAVGEMQRQLKLIQENGLTDSEVKKAISYLTGSYAVVLATNSGLATQLMISQVYHLGLDYIRKRNDYYRAVTVAQVNAAARKYIQPDSGALVIAGTYTGHYADPGH